MLEHVFADLGKVRTLRLGLFGAYLDSYVDALEHLGYARTTIQQNVREVVTFGAWLTAGHLSLVAVDDHHVDQFVDERRRKRGHSRQGGTGILGGFVAHLRERGTIATANVIRQASALEQIEGRYERHLRVERGLSSACVEAYLPFVHRLLLERFGAEEPQLGELQPSDIFGFVQRHAHAMSSSRAQLMGSAFRSFFRYLLQRGEIAADLASSVPSVPDWRLSSVPRYIEPEQVELLLRGCDQNTATGRRDYAILLLLARLGLRAGEVVRLELSDIDWRRGELRIRGKGRSIDHLPLLTDVGKALAAYLQQDRPQSTSRQVFLRMRAPCRGFASAAAVTVLVVRAIERVGLKPPMKGAHLLRHSLASSLLHNGASMAEIAELLRHRSPRTTEIYAKVDLTGLRSVSRPWPVTGGLS